MKNYFLVFILLFSSILQAALYVEIFENEFVIYPNIKKTTSDINDYFKSIISNKNLILIVEGNIISIPLNRVISLKIRDLERKIINIRKKQGRWDRIRLRFFGDNKVYKITPKFNINRDFLIKKIEKINELYGESGKDAKIIDFKGYKKLIRHENALRIDIKDFDNKISDLFKDISFLKRSILKLELNFIEISPFITVDDILNEYGFKYIVSERTTNFDISFKERFTNIKLAMNAIDGILLFPDEIFSYNRILGARTRERGYESATSIIAGRLSSSIGGGICQVSSTLYGPVLLAGFKILKQYNHSMRGPGLDYVPIGEDAAVVFGVKDFIFKNDYSDIKFIILANLEDGKVNIRILSDKPLPYKFKLKKKFFKRNNLITVKVYREKYKDNTLINTEYIATNTYKIFKKNE